MRTAIFVTGYKGGTGKSVFARALLDRYRRTKKSAVAVDCDGGVGQLFQHYAARGGDGKPLANQSADTGVLALDARDAKSLPRILDALELGGERVLYDLPGGVLDKLGDAVAIGATPEALVRDCADSGYAVTVVIVISPVLAAARAVKTAIAAFGPLARYVVVRNAAFGDTAAGDEGDFCHYYGYTNLGGFARGGEGRKTLLERGGKEIILPELRRGVLVRLDRESQGFSQAVSDMRWPRSIRSPLGEWLRLTDVELEKARDELGVD